MLNLKQIISYQIFMEKVLKNKKVHIITTCGVVAVAGILLFQGSIPSDSRQVKLNAISPNQGVAGTEVVITGSGFSSSVQGITGTKVNDIVYAPGNYVLLQGDVIAGPILSPDGKTLAVRISVDSEKVRMYCEEKFRSKEPCKVQAKVVNAYSKQSNGQYFTILYSAPPVAQSCTLAVSIASTTPAAQTISPGQSGVTLVKFNATSNCDGTLNSFAVSLLPMPSGYQAISSLRIYDDVSGVQLGSTQSVSSASVNFATVNTPLMTNQTRVLKIVGDVSPSAIIGSTVYGVFGGSYGVTGSGGVIGNNASGNIFAGNIMTIR